MDSFLEPTLPQFGDDWKKGKKEEKKGEKGRKKGEKRRKKEKRKKGKKEKKGRRVTPPPQLLILIDEAGDWSVPPSLGGLGLHKPCEMCNNAAQPQLWSHILLLFTFICCWNFCAFISTLIYLAGSGGFARQTSLTDELFSLCGGMSSRLLVSGG